MNRQKKRLRRCSKKRLGFEQHFASEALDDARKNREEMTLLERMGVSDVESVKVQGRTFTAAALRNLVINPSKKPDLAIFCGEEPVNEYNNPSLIMGMFPYGVGGFEDPARSVPVSFQKQANYYLDIASRVFRYHSTFFANFDSVARELSGLRVETLAEVVKHLEQEGRIESLTVEQKRVFILLNQVKTIAAKVTGSEVTKITFRNEIRSYVGPFGVPHLFFTANPNPSNSPLFQIMWGDETINLDEKTPTLVEYAKRGMRLAEDPVAALDFFNFTVRCMIEYLFGWDFEKSGLLKREVCLVISDASTV
ncbi:uncharacterized protein ARMOST_20944 [Armillaria ostoyae]|uniref:Helitron helicase-like domain-containing protein n=1 Tax=Armillaria ostoyae TaxID=47428 RepID=A0A284S8Q6_ARMOS|nr:uncharacterized protein ARMOST_20944 [Armillaria ostoyae]